MDLLALPSPTVGCA
ncbi:impB/mucB/samB family protein, partial [Vibrio parahaemolyticus VP2007-007]